MQWISDILQKCHKSNSSISKKCRKFIAWKMLEIKSQHLTWVGSYFLPLFIFDMLKCRNHKTCFGFAGMYYSQSWISPIGQLGQPAPKLELDLTFHRQSTAKSKTILWLWDLKTSMVRAEKEKTSSMSSNLTTITLQKLTKPTVCQNGSAKPTHQCITSKN